MAPETVRLASCPSTMDEARRLARGGAPDGTVVVAERQTRARGRLGRPWHAPEGGLYISIVLRGLDRPDLLTLALANAVADTLEVAGVEPGVKWVNDVWADGRKLAGILVEGESTGGGVDFLVAGIGVNINGDPEAFPPSLAASVTTLEAELGAKQCIEDVEALLLEEVHRWVGRVREGRGAEVLDAWRARDVLRGKAVQVETPGGNVEGVAEGVDDDGRLLVRSGPSLQAVDAGTAHLRLAA